MGTHPLEVLMLEFWEMTGEPALNQLLGNPDVQANRCGIVSSNCESRLSDDSLRQDLTVLFLS